VSLIVYFENQRSDLLLGIVAIFCIFPSLSLIIPAVYKVLDAFIYGTLQIAFKHLAIHCGHLFKSIDMNILIIFC
jgi:hypothetical protein